MKYLIDHDFHIHSRLSACSSDEMQTTENILDYGIRNGFKNICLTDHGWDENVPCKTISEGTKKSRSLSRLKTVLPLPQSESCRFLFGFETDTDADGNIGVTRKEADEADFIILSPSHLHTKPFTVENSFPETPEDFAKLYTRRLFDIFKADLPFEKCGISHFTTHLVFKKAPEICIDCISDETLHEFFSLVKQHGTGVEINAKCFAKGINESMLRPYKIAKDEGCLFYLGSDSHHPSNFVGVKEIFEYAADLLCLTENDKFHLTYKIK